MKLDFMSVLKAGAVAVAVNIVLGILGALPLIGPLFWVCTCVGGLLVPIGAGLLYGYFAPGEEEIGQAAVGGGLSGLAAGLIYGLFRILTTSVLAVIDGNPLGDVIVNSSLDLFGTFCGAIIFGSILGAIGGAVWMLIQGRNK